MRLSFVQRLVRFLFLPMCMFAAVSMLHQLEIYKDIDDYCVRREECLASCVRDNFPSLTCALMDDKVIEYRGNAYEHFFVYDKPAPQIGGEVSEHFDKCAGYIDENPLLPVSGQDPDRQLKLATCFEPCKTNAACLLGFDYDDREPCSSTEEATSILCVNPLKTPCENYVEHDQYCFNED